MYTIEKIRSLGAKNWGSFEKAWQVQKMFAAVNDSNNRYEIINRKRSWFILVEPPAYEGKDEFFLKG